MNEGDGLLASCTDLPLAGSAVANPETLGTLSESIYHLWAATLNSLIKLARLDPERSFITPLCATVLQTGRAWLILYWQKVHLKGIALGIRL